MQLLVRYYRYTLKNKTKTKKSLLYFYIIKMVYWKLKNLKILMIGLLW
jgi:hypothetical protein